MEKLPLGLLAIVLAAVITITGCSLFGKKKELKTIHLNSYSP